MFSIKKIKKNIMKKLRMFRRHYRYKYYFPKYYKECCKQPVKDNKVLFLEMRFTTLSNSFDVLYKTLEESGEYEIKTAFVQYNFIRGKAFTKKVEAMIRELATSKYVILDEASMILSCLPLRKETKAINLWHGCGAFKKFGRSTAEKKFGADARTLDKFPNYKNLSLVTVSSPEVVWAYEEAMHLPKGIVRPLGISRTDQFYDQAYLSSLREKVCKVMPAARDKKIILYAPTFRGHVSSAKSPDMIDFSYFKEKLGEDYVILCKHHPFVKNPPLIPEDCLDFAMDVTSKLNIEDLLATADICVSDYSSLVFEYSLFEKPMIFYAYDYDDYCDWRGFYYDYSDFTPGPIVKDQEALLDALLHAESQMDKEKLAAFRNKFMSSCDGHATDRIIQWMKDQR